MRMSFVLGQVEDAPFGVPPGEFREDLRHGDLAELMLLSENLTEPAWAEVVDVLAPGWYAGVLESGETVEFGPEHVMDIRTPRTGMLGVSDVFRRAAEARAVPPPPPARPGVFERVLEPGEEEEPRRGWSFFDIFRRRRPEATQVGPIPEAERRRGFPALPPPEPAAPPEQESVFQPPVPTAVIVPPASPFEVIAPAPVAAQVPVPFEILAPAPAFPVMPSAPAGPFEVLAPLASPAAGPFEVLAPLAPPAAGPFEVLVPAAAEPFETLAPTGLVPSGPFEVLVPGKAAPELPVEVLQPMVPSVPEKEPDLFDVVEAGRPEEPPERIGSWAVPTPAQWRAHFKTLERTHKYPTVEELIAGVEEDRRDPWFREAQTGEPYTGIPATIPIETATDWTKIMKFLGIPKNVWQPYSKAMQDEREDSWERFDEELVWPLSRSLGEMFSRVKKLPGFFTLGEDGGTEGQTWGLVYYEPLSHKEADRLAEKLVREQESEEKETAQRLKSRKWNPPRAPEAKREIRKTFDLEALFGDVRRERRSDDWKDEVRQARKSGDDAEMILQKFGSRDEGEQFLYQLASLLSLPDNVMETYFGDPARDLGEEFEAEVLRPTITAYNVAFGELMPEDLPGKVTVAYTSEGDLFLVYYERTERR